MNAEGIEQSEIEILDDTYLMAMILRKDTQYWSNPVKFNGVDFRPLDDVDEMKEVLSGLTLE